MNEIEFDPAYMLLESEVEQNPIDFSKELLGVSGRTRREVTEDAQAIFQAAVNSVRSDYVLESQLEWDGRWLSFENEQVQIDLKDANKIIVIGAGKATYGMLVGLLRVFRRSQKPHPPIIGWINIPEGIAKCEEPIPDSITVCHARPQGLNEPTDRVVAGTREILQLVKNACASDCTIALISGGGSALLCEPIEGISLQQKVELTRALSSAGANIEQLNAVRRCLSRVKGGGLARACQSRTLVTCILSDVLGDPLEFIASGPTILNPSADPEYAIKILERLLPHEFQSIRKILLHSPTHQSAEPSPSASSALRPVFVLANNATAVDAAGCKAVELGYRYWMKSETRSEGSAEEVGRKLIRQIGVSVQDRQFDCIISGGEPTVRLPPSNERGQGGRNQQLALAALIEADAEQLAESIEFCVLSGGTDGEDGPTDAAGAYINNNIVRQMNLLHLNPSDFLRRCDAYRFFATTGGLLKTGPTNTNVCDIRIALWRKKSQP